jgi:hypothetical protein
VPCKYGSSGAVSARQPCRPISERFRPVTLRPTLLDGLPFSGLHFFIYDFKIFLINKGLQPPCLSQMKNIRKTDEIFFFLFSGSYFLFFYFAFNYHFVFE